MTNVAGDFIPTSPEPAKPLGLERRRVWQSVMLSAVIFLAGGASGWGLSVALAPRGGGPQWAMRPDPPVEDIVRNMREELLLTADQTSKVKDVYQTRFEALKTIRLDMAPKIKTEYEALRVDIEKILTPEQFKRWNQRFMDVSKRMLPPPPPNGPPRMGPDGPRNGPPPFEGGGMNPGMPGEGIRPNGSGPWNGPGQGGRRPPPPPPNGGDGPQPGEGPGPGRGPGMAPGSPPGTPPGPAPAPGN